MKFCEECGKTFSILDRSEKNCCSDCTGSSHKIESTTVKNSDRIEGLSSSTISVDNNRISLHSKEGWLLWSGDIGESHAMEAITRRAMKILKIRQKRKG